MIPHPVVVILIVAQYVAPLLCTATSGTYAQFVSRSPKCGTNEPVKSFKVRSRVQCISECQHRTNQHQQQQQLSPCVGVNYWDTEAACDVFDQEPTSYSTTTPICQYFGLKLMMERNQSLFAIEDLTTSAIDKAIPMPSATTEQATSAPTTSPSTTTRTTTVTTPPVTTVQKTSAATTTGAKITTTQPAMTSTAVTTPAATTEQATSVPTTSPSTTARTTSVTTPPVTTAQRTSAATTTGAKITTTQPTLTSTAASPSRVLIQNYDGKGAFNRLWSEFKSGFNDSVGNFWLGNDMISNLTLMTSCNSLTFELQASSNGKWYVANYDSFVVYNETLSYRMYVSGYSGNASDSFTNQNGMMFTTKDRGHDLYSGGNCAVYEGGGFWYNNCAHAHVANTIGVGNDFTWYYLPTGSSTLLSKSRMWLVCG